MPNVSRSLLGKAVEAPTRLKPKRPGRDDRIKSGALPPSRFVAAAVDLAMVSSTQGDGELIADLTPERAGSGKSQMVGVRRPSAANQARMLGDRFDMFPVTDPAWLRQGQQALVDELCPPPSPALCVVPITRLRRAAAGRSGAVSTVLFTLVGIVGEDDLDEYQFGS
jgi:hypothetical protein